MFDSNDDSLSSQAKILEDKFFDAIWSGTEWLSAEQIVRLSEAPFDFGESLVRWESERRLFGLERDGVKVYPAYAFTGDFKPIPAVALVLDIFRGRSALGVAAFFEGTSSFLGGRRPREALAQDPGRVIAKAQNDLEWEEFGG